MTQKERYSILRPLTVHESELFAIQMCNFFSPMSYRKNCELLGITAETKSIKPFTFGNLLNYLKKVTQIDSYKYLHHLNVMIQKFTARGYFVHAGDSHQGSPPMNKCFYSQFELTELQKTNTFWLGSILGEEFLMEKLKPYIVRFEGEYSDGIAGTGSGILIDDSTVLTCRHNLTDLNSYRCFIGEYELPIDTHKYHDIHDIGIVKLKEKLSFGNYPYLGPHYVLDSTLTLGYPPLRGMREAPLISQKGEINARSKDWNNCECITISSTVRPGNSGGPVVSLSGYIVGIVTQFANSASSASSEKDGFKDDPSIPFYNAITSSAIYDLLPGLDNTLQIRFENYN